MKYLWNLILSLKEVFLLMLLQYVVLIICFIVFGSGWRCFIVDELGGSFADSICPESEQRRWNP